MENLSKSIANKIALELNIDNDRKEVMAYGTFALLQTFLLIFLTIIFGYLFHVAIEALIILFTASILRKHSGGAHASSPSNCTLIGLTMCIGQARLISPILNMLVDSNIISILMFMIFVWSYYMIYKLVPVDSPAKPINNKNIKKRMKKHSIMILSIYFITVVSTIILYFNFQKVKFLVYALSISVGIAWQIFTLTKYGHSVLNKMDAFLNFITK